MKTINQINYIVIAIPFLLCGIGCLIKDPGDNLFCFGILSTILTGAYQVLAGILLLIENYKDRMIQVYLTLVALFFLLWYMNISMVHKDWLTFILFPIPAILCIYFSVILHQKLKK